MLMSNKKIISFGLWGDKPKYIQGAYENITLYRDLLPDWICRFYINNSISSTVSDKLKTIGAEVFLYPVPEDFKDKDNMFWRFTAIYDREVEYVLSRDSDSRPSLREIEFVTQWLESNKTVHMIRDHKYHTVPIMGGMCGFNAKNMRNKYPDMRPYFYQYISEKDTFICGPDQDFLGQFLFPKILNDNMTHASYNLLLSTDIKVQPDDENFIGKDINVE